jgi:diguanylate cyclase (GGDEF)-like protein
MSKPTGRIGRPGHGTVRRIVTVVLGVGTLLSLSCWLAAARWADDLDRAEFVRRATNHQLILQTGFREYEADERWNVVTTPVEGDRGGVWRPSALTVLGCGLLATALGALLARQRARRQAELERLAADLRVTTAHLVEQAEQRVSYLADHDVVTGLLNRAFFVARLTEHVEEFRRGASPFAVHYLDLDHFKDVNDTLGHDAGDDLLKEIGQRLLRAVRTTDVVARLGGDEFAVLQADTKMPDDAAVLAVKLRDLVTAPYILAGNHIVTTASIGIALSTGDTADAATMMKQADIALYKAKGEGRDRFCFHSEELGKAVRARVALASELRRAVAEHEFFLEYQPQFALAGDELVGVEALLRWRHPAKGVVAPDLFMPAAESSGLILPIGDWVLREALRQGRAWIDAGCAPTTLAVNVSAIQIKASDFEARLMEALRNSGFPAQCLELELTETVLFETTKVHEQILVRLHDAGIRVAIDDFGTGFSSLAYLMRFHTDRLKIAQTFVRHIATDEHAASIVKAAVSLAQALGLSVVAEGVESPEQLEMLRRFGCDAVQGYLYAPPLSADGVADLVRARRSATLALAAE